MSNNTFSNDAKLIAASNLVIAAAVNELAAAQRDGPVVMKTEEFIQRMLHEMLRRLERELSG